MLNPSYSDLIDILNEDIEKEEQIDSRYSIVIAAAKRARQIIGGLPFDDAGSKTDKAVSIAVNEMQRGFIRVIPSEDSPLPNIITDPILQNIPSVIDESFVTDVDIEINPYEETEARHFKDEDEKDYKKSEFDKNYEDYNEEDYEFGDLKDYEDEEESFED